MENFMTTTSITLVTILSLGGVGALVIGCFTRKLTREVKERSMQEDRLAHLELVGIRHLTHQLHHRRR